MDICIEIVQLFETVIIKICEFDISLERCKEWYNASLISNFSPMLEKKFSQVIYRLFFTVNLG